MEQLNKDLPPREEGRNAAEVTEFPTRPTSSLLIKVRNHYGIFGMISLVFGIAFAFFFYEAGMGLNMPAFVATIIVLLLLITNKLQIPVKKITYGYYLGALMLSISSALTSSEILHLLDAVGVLLLLDVSLLHQFHQDKDWEFGKYIGRVFGLPIICISKLGMPFVDSFRFLNNLKAFKSKRTKNMVIGALIALPLLWLVTFLLAQADYMFQKLTRNSFDFLFSSNIISVSIMIVFGFLACYCIICGSVDKTLPYEGEGRIKKADSGIAATTMVLILVVYLVFCFIQMMYLFSNGWFSLPQEYTFAEYARRGFFELLAVTGINIVLMIICSMLFEESKALRLVLTGITICTYIMIASAAYRMLLYISAYNLTFLRLFVLLFLLIDALILAGIILSQYRRNFPLFPYCVAVISICYLAFSFARPDFYIASYQIKHEEQLSMEDLYYLTNELSLDTAPILIPFLTDPKNEKQLSEIRNEPDSQYYELNIADITQHYFDRIVRIRERQGIRDFNYSDHKAIQLFEQYLEK